MRSNALFLVSCAALLVLGISLTIGNLFAADVEAVTPDPSAELTLRFTLRRDLAGDVGLRLDMPVDEASLRMLLDGKEKHPAVVLNAAKDVPYGEVAKTIELFKSLGLDKLSLEALDTEAE